MATSTDSTYKSFDSLDQESHYIRLLRLKPTLGSLIECELTECELGPQLAPFNASQRPPYTALSYTWDPSHPEREILVNGKRFTIGDNLWQFLCKVRTDHESYYWIDQICIDQANTRERNHQVQFMCHIYHQARDVVVWLGPERDYSGRAMDFIRYHANCAFVTSDLIISCLVALFNRRYWRRLWVIQEIMFARRIRVKCGDRTIDWGRLVLMHQGFKSPDMLLRYNQFNIESPGHVKHMIEMKIKWSLGCLWHPSRQGWREVLPSFDTLKCGNILDRV